MKRDEKELNLRNALPGMPEACKEAFSCAVRSVKEEKKKMKKSFRVLVIAAVVLAVTVSAALAAGSLGLIDFFGKHYGGSVYLPREAQKELEKTSQKTYTLGNVDAVLRETMADEHLCYITVEFMPHAGEKALLMGGFDDAEYKVPDSETRRLGLKEGITFGEAARQVPVYAAGLYLDYDPETLDLDCEMYDTVYGEDGGMLLVNMLLARDTFPCDSIEGKLALKAQKVESAENMEAQSWKAEDSFSVKVTGVTKEKEYALPQNAALSGLEITAVRAEKTCAGVYILTTCQGQGAYSEFIESDLMGEIYEWVCADENGNPLPGGISLSGGMNSDAEETWPAFTLTQMIGADEIPEKLMLQNLSGESVVLK